VLNKGDWNEQKHHLVAFKAVRNPTCMPIIVASWEAEVGGSQFEASLGKVRPYLIKQPKAKGVKAWLKRQRVPKDNPQCQKKESHLHLKGQFPL
jgi:hypothetical protein